MYKYILAALPMVFSLQAHAMDVVTSIKPIQMITYALTEGVTKPSALLPSSASPHDYALKPSDVKTLKGADLVIWFGPELEPFMAKLVVEHPSVLTLSDVEGLPLRAYDEEGHHHDHDHDHDHGSHDPHFWLGIEPVKHAATAIANALAKADATHAATYQQNLARFLAELEETKAQIQTSLARVKGNGYFVFHDAYGYFESEFGLNKLGYFTVSPERKPGAKTLITIRKALAEHPRTCVFAEPQFTPAVINTVVRGSDANIGRLDPMGMEVQLNAHSYFDFLNQMSHDLYQCLIKQSDMEQ